MKPERAREPYDRAKALPPALPKRCDRGGEQALSPRTERTIDAAQLTREARLACGWTEDTAAAVGGVSRALYREWERDERDDHSTDARTPVEHVLSLDPPGVAVFARRLCSILGWVPGVALAGTPSTRLLLAHVPVLSREAHESTEVLVRASCERSPGGAGATDDELAAIEAQLLEHDAAIQSALADVRARRKAVR